MSLLTQKISSENNMSPTSLLIKDIPYRAIAKNKVAHILNLDKNIFIFQEFETLKKALNMNKIQKVSLEKVLQIIRNIGVYIPRIGMNYDAIIETIYSDITSFQSWDPASLTYDLEGILSTRIGMNYTIIHRLLHEIAHSNEDGSLLLAETIAKNIYRSVDIHPLARIGPGWAFDHAISSVIGATSIIGEGFRMYHGTTLGGSGVEINEIDKDSKTIRRRHPKIGNSVMIGAHTTILGPTSIPDEVTIGAGVTIVNRLVELPKESVIIRNVSADSWLVKNPEGEVKEMGFKRI